jgi:hypothetical protein
MFTKHFWLDALERAIKTIAQVFLAVVVEEQFFNAFELDWTQMAGIAVGAGLVSVATSLASSRFGKHDSASLVDFDDE